MTLEVYAARLEAELTASAEQAIQTAKNSYGEASAQATRQLYDEVMADKAHWSGLLTLVGYALEAGTDDAMIIQAARAMELLRASASLNGLAATTGREQAYMTLANLDGVADDNKLKAISICARSTLLNAHGVMNDAFFTNPMHVGMVLAGAGCSATDDITPFVRALAVSSAQTLVLAQHLAGRWPEAQLLSQFAESRLQS